MPDDQGRYTDAETFAHRPPPCAAGGGPTRQEWNDATTFGEGARWFPGLLLCLDPECLGPTE